MMAAAVLELFPEAKLGIGPAIKDGFYYDFDLPRPLTPGRPGADRGARCASSRPPISPFERSRGPSARRCGRAARGAGPAVKVEIVSDLDPSEGPTVSFYRHGTFEDLCRGGHLARPADPGAFRLLNTAGAYWRGDETRPMLQRIYGTAWDTQDELDRHLWRLEEAKKRDHRKLGRELDLFTFHPESPAAPFLHPRGMAIWRALEDWSLEVRRAGGFSEVRTPSLVRKELWETSGHWNHYQDNMFVLDDHDHVSGLKPMNCPEEILVYRTRARSYRELPIRFADYSVLFRKERTGVLAGMFRVRQLAQDDSHVFCRDDQVDDEIHLALSLVRKQYGPFGFAPRSKLATRPEKRLGSDEFWERAEGTPAGAPGGVGMPYAIDPGGGAFYAPKIDIFIEDALGREWQIATVQADYQLPQRFDLEYRAADGGFERPGRHPLRDLRLVRAVHRHHHRALRRRLPALAGAGPGDGRADRRPPPGLRGVGPRCTGRRRPASGGRRPVRADAGQAARGPGAEDPGHGGGGRPRRRGRRRLATAAHRRVVAGRAARRVRGRPHRPRRVARAVAGTSRGGPSRAA